MADPRLRQHIARLAAQLMYERLETEYFTAKRKAAKQLGIDARYRPKDLPSNAEIRERIRVLAELHEGERRGADLQAMRLAALRLMRRLKRFRPALIGSVCTGHIRQGSDIDIHVFSDQIAAVTMALDDAGLEYEVERKRVVKHGEERVFYHLHVRERFEFELTVYPEAKLGYVFKSSITGQAIERLSLNELDAFLRREYPDAELDAEEPAAAEGFDRFELYRLLLQPLERVKQSPKWHPEGDALYHSLQVFERAREARPYDEEFLLAALLHDVGKAIEPSDHVAAGLEALEGAISERTAFLIEHHMDAHAYREGSLGHRARVRLQESDELEDLMLLQELDLAGRVPGAEVGSVEDALEFLRALDESSG
ncbi:MAG: HD domain-containing protein [Planctomycetota bacterium]|nr:HD domain-containing protein [Planctomycetota bacterium]